MPTPEPASHSATTIPEALEPQTRALQIIAGLLLFGAATMLGSILVPTILALILAITLSPVVSWLERKGVPTTLGSLACMLAVALALGVTLGLLVYQAGTVLQNSDRYVHGVATVIARVSSQAGSDHVMASLGLLDHDGGSEAAGGSTASWERFLRKNLQTVGAWVATGLGGLLGFAMGLVIFLAFLFYMLQTRVDWMERLTLAFARIGLRPRLREMGESQREIEVFVGFVSLVAFCYFVVSSLFYWWIGLPTPLLWGVLTGLLEFIPFFGPTIAGAMISLVALTLGTLWQPAAVVGFFVALHLLEGYVITPMIYGSAVKIDPVTTLFGVMFFGWLWGPLGSMMAMPMLILIRGLIVMTPDTPALDAIADVEERKDEGPVEDEVLRSSG